MIELELHDPGRQEDLGRRLAPLLSGPCLVFLAGELGTGKTTIVRGILAGLGHRGAVRSPTYTLVEPYELGGRAVFHLDLYRLGDPEELEYLGLRDMLSDDNLLLVEWPERGAVALPTADVSVELAYAGARARKIRLEGLTGRGRAILAGTPYQSSRK